MQATSKYFVLQPDDQSQAIQVVYAINYDNAVRQVLVRQPDDSVCIGG